MSRRDEFKSESKNPCTRFLEWKSDNKNFSYYDKDKKENIPISLPFTFLVLKEMHTVKGWHDGSESAIYANEVEKIGKDKLTVKSFKGGLIATGVYKDIKEVISGQGAHYSKSIYCMDMEGNIINIQLKGSCVQSWGDFTQKSRVRLSDEWVTVNEVEEKQKGKVKYTVPIFSYLKSISKEEDNKSEEAYSSLEEYFGEYLSEKVIEEDSKKDESTKEKPVLYADSETFSKILKKIELDPSISLETISQHYEISEGAIKKLDSVMELPF
jgi:hypothetical protein